MNDSEETEKIQDWDDEDVGRSRKGKPAENPAEAPSSGNGDVPSEDGDPKEEADPRHDELAALVDSAEEKETVPNSANPVKETGDSPLKADALSADPLEPKKGASTSAEAAAAEQSGSYAYPDAGAASSPSQRLRPIPPDKKKKTPWWIRHRRELILAEVILTGLFFLLTLYFLFMWIFSAPEMACIPQPSWKTAPDDGRWTTIVVHHTATDLGSPESIDRYHRNVRKWEGLGYHFLIGNGRPNGRDPMFGNGAIHVGDRWLEQRSGAHVRMKNVKNANSFAIGIALIGNFEKEPPTPQQVAALRCLLGFLMETYHIPKSSVYGHGSVSQQHTDCPGKLMPLDEILASL